MVKICIIHPASTKHLLLGRPSWSDAPAKPLSKPSDPALVSENVRAQEIAASWLTADIATPA